MIIKVEEKDFDKFSALLLQMFRLRARVFGQRLKWDVSVVDGKEHDKYDDEGPIYILYTDEREEELWGCLRLLPTTGPTVLADIFSDTLPDAVHLSSPTIWECTRFCLDERILAGDRRAVVAASGALLAGLGEIAIEAGITTIVGNFDPMMLHIYRRIGCEVEVLGCTHRFGRPVYLGAFPVSEAILDRVKSRLVETQAAPSLSRHAPVSSASGLSPT